jgi:hypothetical protein
MIYADKLALLEVWQSEIKRSDERFRPLRDALGSSGESAPELAIFHLQEAYTKTMADLLGVCADALSWYWLENDLGRRGMSAGPVGATRPIATLDDLLWLLEVPA